MKPYNGTIGGPTERERECIHIKICNFEIRKFIFNKNNSLYSTIDLKKIKKNLSESKHSSVVINSSLSVKTNNSWFWSEHISPIFITESSSNSYAPWRSISICFDLLMIFNNESSVKVPKKIESIQFS